MVKTYFLGANSKDGFFSLYAGFPPDGAFLHILKGGPGTGKSGFMRRIAQEAAARGMDTEQVLCSGDPDSLDGVYIPQLAEAWVDGTAPHVVEPGIFGVFGDYVNLGQFCALPLSPDEKELAMRLSAEYKEQYRRAYGFLSAAASLRLACAPDLFGDEERSAIRKRVCGILDRLPRRGATTDLPCRRLFLSALSSAGSVRLNGSVSELCKLIYQFDDGLRGADLALELVRQEAEKRGACMILCPQPLCPQRLEAALLPEYSLGFVGGAWELPGARHFRLDRLISPDTQRLIRRELREGRRMERDAAAAGLERLRTAKALHDELEAVYHPHMDFAALDEFTERELLRVFA